MKNGNKRIIDITQPIATGMEVWPGDPQTQIETESIDGAFVTKLCLSVHAATHVDAPRHRDFKKSGVESLDLEVLCGPAAVIRPTELSNNSTLIEKLSSVPVSTERVLINTGHYDSRQRGGAEFLNYPGLSLDLTENLIKNGIKLIGTDAPSIERSSDLDEGNFSVHDALFEADVIILENLNLGHVDEGEYDLYCLPLLIPGIDGAPARAVLLPREDQSIFIDANPCYSSNAEPKSLFALK